MIISKETMLCITVGDLVGFTVTMLNVLLDKCYLVYKKSKGESEKARLLINEKYFNSL